MNITYKSTRKFGAALGVAFLVSISSCSEEEYLQQVPPTQLSDSDIFSTPARIEGLVNGIYSSLKGANFYGGRLLLFLDVRGEDFINTTANSFTGYDAWAHSYNSASADILNVWSTGYTTINRANVLIEGLTANPGVVDETTATGYIAEAKFLRALSYYTLVTIFARPYTEDNGASPGLPLRLIAELTPENNGLARSTVAQVYTQVLQDLDEAEADLPEAYSTALLNTTRAHRNTAIALKTRVYLNQGNWNAVIAEASKIVPQTSAPFSATAGVENTLHGDIVEALASNFTTAESIFSMPFTNLDNLGGQSALGYLYNGNSEYFMNPAGILGSSQWAEGDARRELLRFNGTNGRYYLGKYGQAAPFLRYIPVIRYAEVLLNYAEAAAETGNLALATELLEAVHHRSDPDYVFPASATATSAALITSIETERRIELLGEGFRSNDLLRRLYTIPEKVGPAFSASAVAPSAANYIWPMSNDEILTNNLIFD
ncbi:RagB/SusD family nutrient uptake outer membrane protein [Parapedobacter koreensis]|uniref:SusD family protein n=1 Tax=Parapedobacter koreensis TaxID=332977 RepID=A0A1H7RR36_9SPHI|nr:RagB/SusD family nutrient uptake outer membrane protein [Parapedobacter koreensis]SEL62683.1 SusD family protein [Parapedobacter koreensis]